MASIIAIVIAGIVGAGLTLHWKRALLAWLCSCSVVPLFILLSEFVMPYAGSGASMWPIAMVFGSILGALAGAFGVALASTAIKDSDHA